MELHNLLYGQAAAYDEWWVVDSKQQTTSSRRWTRSDVQKANNDGRQVIDARKSVGKMIDSGQQKENKTTDDRRLKIARQRQRATNDK